MRPWSLTTQTTTFGNIKKCREETENEDSKDGGKEEENHIRGKFEKGEELKKNTTYREKFQNGK
jgi:hypothetical protein